MAPYATNAERILAELSGYAEDSGDRLWEAAKGFGGDVQDLGEGLTAPGPAGPLTSPAAVIASPALAAGAGGIDYLRSSPGVAIPGVGRGDIALPQPRVSPSGPLRGAPPSPSAGQPPIDDVARIRGRSEPGASKGIFNDRAAIEGLRARSGAAGDARLLRPLLASLGTPAGGGTGFGNRFVGGAGDIVDMAGRARTARILDALFGPTESINRDPVADSIGAAVKGLELENLQPVGATSSIRFGIPGETDLMEYEDANGAPPMGLRRIGELRAAQNAALGIGAGGRGGAGIRPSDRRAMNQDSMRAYYVGQLDKLERALDADVAAGRRTQEQADEEYRKAERSAAFHINALGGESTAGFFARPLE